MNFTELMNWVLGRDNPKVEEKADSKPENKRIVTRLNFPDGTVHIHGVGDFPLIDLAQRGLSLDPLEHSLLANPHPGMKMPATIRLGTMYLDTELTFRYVDSGKIGCSFDDLSMSRSRVLNDFLNPCLLGAGLREIRTREEGLRWFQGDDSCQLYYWKTSDGGFEKADLYFMGYAISFNGNNNTLRTGFFRFPFGAGSREIDPEKNPVVYNAVPSYRVLRLAHLFFNYAELPEEIYVNIASIAFREEKCSFSRVLIGEKEKNVTFSFSDDFGNAALKVASLCSSAISAVLPDPPPKRTVLPGTELSGTLNLPDRKFPAVFRVVYQQDFLLGGSLRLLNSEDSEYFAAFMTPRLLGQSLEALPPPAEQKPFAPGDAQPYLYVGLHNTHLLALVSPPQKLLYGRLVFSDRIIIWDKNSLSMFSIPQGLIFPYDWDIVTVNHEELPNSDPKLLSFAKEIIQNSNISSDLKKAWEEILPN